MNPPTIAYDKSLHGNYGAVICALTIIAGAVVGKLTGIPVWLAPPLGLALAGLIGKLTEMRQKQINEKRLREAAAHGAGPETVPLHNVDPADVRATAWGAFVVALPAAVVIMLR
jgi:hypothetical protein